MKRGDIVLTNFEPTIGKELKKDKRPAVITSNDGINDTLEIFTVAPIRTRKRSHERKPIYYMMDADDTNGLANDSTVDCTQIRSVDASRFVQKIGEATEEQMADIAKIIYLNNS